MAKRSIQASLVGVQQAKRAFALKGWTQDNLAAEANLKTRQPIWRFLTGQPVDRQVFMEICLLLDLDWRKIASDPPAEFIEPGILTKTIVINEVNTIDIDKLVQKVRGQHHEAIENQCGILQLLDVGHPVSIDDIYVDVNILEEIASQQWLEIADLQSMDPEKFDHVGLGNIDHSQIPGMEAVETYSKLRVLGKLPFCNIWLFCATGVNSLPIKSHSLLLSAILPKSLKTIVTSAYCIIFTSHSQQSL
jgi:predicted NACHT family NTPase